MKFTRKSISGILLNRLLMLFNINMGGIFIGKGSILSSNQVEIGCGTRINGKIIIKGGGAVSLGKYCAIGDGVRVISSNHAMNTASLQLALQKRVAGVVHLMSQKSGVIIGHDVWIGDAAIILPGVSIGNGAVVGAGAIVTRSVEPYDVVAGNPARKIGRRFSKEIAVEMEALQWWNWTESEMRRVPYLFMQPLLESESEKVLALITQAKEEVGK